jgi:hypothetical protein
MTWGSIFYDTGLSFRRRTFLNVLDKVTAALGMVSSHRAGSTKEELELETMETTEGTPPCVRGSYGGLEWNGIKIW